MIFFDVKIETRISHEMAKDMDRAIRQARGRSFDSRSHFTRCAVMHFINYLKEQGEIR